MKVKKNLILVLSMAIFGFSSLYAYGGEPTAREIMTREDERPDGEDRISVMTMMLIHHSGNRRVRKVESFSKDYGEESVLGHACWKIESIPVNPDDMYTRKVLWVGKEAYLILQAEYYDKDGLIKIYRALDVRQQDGFWVTFVSEMDNVSRNHKTRMETESLRHDTGLEDNMFKVAAIQRGTIQEKGEDYG